MMKIFKFKEISFSVHMLASVELTTAELYTTQSGDIFGESSFVEMDVITNTQEYFSKEESFCQIRLY